MSDEKPRKPGGWVKGQSGNPGGRQKGVERRFRDVASSRTYKAKDGEEYSGLDALAQVLIDIAFDQKEKANDRVQAACKYVDRGWGAVKQTVKVESDAHADEVGEFTPEKMSTEELREALDAIATLKRIGGVADASADDSPTEH